MKTITITVQFEGRDKDLVRTFNVSNKLFNVLTLPFELWDKDIEKLIDDSESKDKYFTYVWKLHYMVLDKIIKSKFGIEGYTIEDQDANPIHIDYIITAHKK